MFLFLWIPPLGGMLSCLYLVDYFNSKSFFSVTENFSYNKPLSWVQSSEEMLLRRGINEVPLAESIWRGFGLLDVISDWYPS